jgi:hypothetical protein
MSDGSVDLATTTEDAFSIPIAKLNPAQPALFAANAMWPCFERLRRDDPCAFNARG